MPDDLTLSRSAPTDTVTLTNANQAYIIAYPADAHGIYLTAKAAACQWAYAGTQASTLGDDSHLIGSDATVLIAGFMATKLPPSDGLQRIYVETETGGTKITASVYYEPVRR